MKIVLLSLMFTMFDGSVQAQSSPTIGAMVQSWRVDPATKIVAIRIVNTSQKDILAYNLSITETFSDGSTSHHELMTDLLDRMVNAQIVKGTIYEKDFSSRFDNGTLAAGKAVDQNVGESNVVTNVETVVDMVAYVDRTADVQNERAFERLVAYRKGGLLAMQKANEVIKAALADPDPATARIAAATELERLANVSRGQNLAPNEAEGYEESRFKEAIMNLNDSQHLSSKMNMTETEYLRTNVTERERRIALAAPHAEIIKTNGGQQ
jgi:hypothetical protein